MNHAFSVKITSSLAWCEQNAKHMMKTQINDSWSYSFCVVVSHCLEQGEQLPLTQRRKEEPDVLL